MTTDKWNLAGSIELVAVGQLADQARDRATATSANPAGLTFISAAGTS